MPERRILTDIAPQTAFSAAPAPSTCWVLVPVRNTRLGS